MLSRPAATMAMFLTAKLAVYTLLGTLLGFFGSLIGLAPSLSGWMQIVVAVLFKNASIYHKALGRLLT